MEWSEALALLSRLAMFGMSPGLERTARALSELRNPERTYRTLHVAGSNGKGSTCAFAAAGLLAAGSRVGLYTSPHLEDITERIAVNGNSISHARLARAIAAVLRACPWAETAQGLTYFELLTVAAFLVFAEERVDVVVMETGLGGRLDATNCCVPTVVALTPISLEHTDVLGSTLAAIAREKAGIVKAGIPCVTAAQPEEVLNEVRAACQRNVAPLGVEGIDFGWSDTQNLSCGDWSITAELSLRGPHQRTNASVAIAALRALSERGVRVGARDAQRGLKDAHWPGRFETVRSNPEVVLDGAHNPAGARALADTVRAVWPGRAIHLVFGALEDKDVAPMIDRLVPLCASVELVRPGSPRGREPATLVERSRKYCNAVHADSSPILALERAIERAGPSGIVLCCGSLYLVGELRRALGGRPENTVPAESLKIRVS